MKLGHSVPPFFRILFEASEDDSVKPRGKTGVCQSRRGRLYAGMLEFEVLEGRPFKRILARCHKIEQNSERIYLGVAFANLGGLGPEEFGRHSGRIHPRFLPTRLGRSGQVPVYLRVPEPNQLAVAEIIADEDLTRVDVKMIRSLKLAVEALMVVSIRESAQDLVE